MKKALQNKAIALRRSGYSYNLIQKQVPVSKSTLTLWLANVPYSPNEIVQNRIRGAILNATQWNQKRKRDSLEKAAREARRDLGKLTKRDLFLLGIGLYIGEGSKTQDQVRIVNSDPDVICLAIHWFTKVLGLRKEHFSPTIHLYPDNDPRESLEFWSRVTDIPPSQFGKTQIDRRLKKPKKVGLLRYGTAHLHICSRGDKRFGVFLSRKINALIREIYRSVR